LISEIFKDAADWYLSNINYASIAVLMAIESSFIPFPSEIVVPPAAWKAAQGKLNIGLVLLFSTLGAMIGAIFNYYFALFLGRRLLYRFAGTRNAHFLLINETSIEKSEDFFRKHGRISTFIGRLVPAIRQLISLPAGLAKMNMGSFLFYTALGAGLWNIILILLGCFLYTQKPLLERYYTAISCAFIVLGVAFVCLIAAKGLTCRKRIAEKSTDWEGTS
jgi:membrane protein DedA with SNARE-associated domain